MEKDIIRLHQLLQEGSCCTAALAALALEGRGEEDPLLVRAASALCKGVHAGEICGAFTGGAMALSLYDPALAASEMIPALADWFRETCGEAYGGTDCRSILAEDPVNRIVRCPALVEDVWRKVRGLLEDEGYEPAAGLEDG